jgi:tetratricopeptide (TPR) repeat protein
MAKKIALLIFLLFLPLLTSGGEVVITPFNSTTRTNDLSWLRFGAPLYLSQILSRTEGIELISWDEFISFLDDEGIPMNASLSLGSLVRIGRDLGATKMIIGSYSFANDKLTLKAKIIDIKRGGIGTEFGASGRKEHLSRIIDELALKIIATLLPEETVPRKSFLGRTEEEALRFYALAQMTAKPEEKIPLLIKSVSASATFNPALLELGELYFLQEEYLKAAELLSRISRDEPSLASARFKAGLAYFQIGEYDKALSSFIDSFTINPNTSSLFNIAASLASSGRYEEASPLIEKLAGIYPKDTSLLLALGYLAWHDEKLEKAEEYLIRAKDIDPSLVPARFLLYKVYEKMGRAEEANDQFLLAKGYAESADIIESLERGDYPFLSLMDEEEGEPLPDNLKEELLPRIKSLTTQNN